MDPRGCSITQFGFAFNVPGPKEAKELLEAAERNPFLQFSDLRGIVSDDQQ